MSYIDTHVQLIHVNLYYLYTNPNLHQPICWKTSLDVLMFFFEISHRTVLAECKLNYFKLVFSTEVIF